MQAHPLYPKVSEVCSKYPDQAGAIWQAYIDLALSQRWQDLEIVDAQEAGCCFLRGRMSKADAPTDLQTVYPLRLAQTTDMESLYGLFEAIEPRPSAILLAISAEDSSIVYYKIAKGIVAPKEVKD